jgi:hypothetical protein
MHRSKMEAAMRVLIPVLTLMLALPALAETPSTKALAYAAQEGFAPGTFGTPFIILATNEGCFDDEGMWGCAVSADGQRYVTYEGSQTPVNILDILAILPIGAEVELSGDAVGDSSGDRVDAVFSRLLMPM